MFCSYPSLSPQPPRKKIPKSRCTSSCEYSYILRTIVHSLYTDTPPTNKELACASLYWVIILYSSHYCSKTFVLEDHLYPSCWYQAAAWLSLANDVGEELTQVGRSSWIYYKVCHVGPWSWVGPKRRLSADELMPSNCGVGEDSWESLGLPEDQTSQS